MAHCVVRGSEFSGGASSKCVAGELRGSGLFAGRQPLLRIDYPVFNDSPDPAISAISESLFKPLDLGFDLRHLSG